MFWILGADGLCSALGRVSDAGWARFAAYQLDHADWEGFRFYDLIFPLFVFIVGVSLVFSLSRTLESEGRGAAVRRILRRTLLMYILALLYYGGVALGWDRIRWVGVLQRIAFCYGVVGLAFCFLKPRALVALCVVALGGYWALMTFAPFPDVRPTPGGTLEVCQETGFTNQAQLNLESPHRLQGVFIKGVNFAHYVDQRYLPGRRWDGTWDPEGLLSNLPALGSCLLGVFAGLWLRHAAREDRKKVLGLAAAGVVLVGLGWLWSLQFPVIKKLWTSSYVLVAGGYSALLLAAFYQVVDVWQWRRWCAPFFWIGMNPITVYLAANFANFHELAERVVGGGVQHGLNAIHPGLGELGVAVVEIAIALALVRFLYRRQIFLRL